MYCGSVVEIAIDTDRFAPFLKGSMMYERSRWLVFSTEVIAMLASALCAAICVAEVLPNSKCLPTALPVMSCGCPNNVIQDVCQGALPIYETMYGDVFCMFNPSTSCDASSATDANKCGMVYHCAGVNCTMPIIYFPSAGCEPHPEKGPCEKKWGSCSYDKAAPPAP